MDRNRKNSNSRSSQGAVFRPFPRDPRRWIELGVCLLLFGAVTLVIARTEIGCVFRYFLGVPCPGCGMSRAWISLFSGDIPSAFRYHFMFFTAPLALLLIPYDWKPFRSDAGNTALYLLLGAGFLVRWILNLTGVLPA